MTIVRSHVRTQATWLALMDLLCLIVGSAIGVLVRFSEQGTEQVGDYLIGHMDGWFLLFGGILLANYLVGNYRIQYTFSRFNLVVNWIFSLAFAFLILSLTSYAWIRFMLGRGVLFLSIVSYSFLSLTLKLLVYRSLFRSDIFLCRVVILGTGQRAREIRKLLENEFVLPAHKVVACIRLPEEAGGKSAGPLVDGVAIVDGTAGNLEDIIRSLSVQLTVIGLDDLHLAHTYYPSLRRLRFDGVELLTPLLVAEIYTGRTPLDVIDEDTLMRATMESAAPMVRRTKRILDIVVSFLALVIFMPLMVCVAILIKLSAPFKPVLYSQIRAGRFGKPFTIHKFRTMRPGAENETGPVWAGAHDERITRVGGVLRRFRLDEMPQFVNVLKGEMSMVGPRPERPEITAELEKVIPHYPERVNVEPGLTGWAQVRYPYGDSVEDACRKLEYDLYYIKNLSLSLDLQIVLNTLRTVLLGQERLT